jgi:hypothetical protein
VEGALNQERGRTEKHHAHAQQENAESAHGVYPLSR